MLAFTQKLLDRVRQLPGVEKAAVTTFLPFFSGNQFGVYIEGQPNGPHDRIMADSLRITPDYFSSLGIRVLKAGSLTISIRRSRKRSALSMRPSREDTSLAEARSEKDSTPVQAPISRLWRSSVLCRT